MKEVGYICVFIAYVFMLYAHILKNKFSTIFKKNLKPIKIKGKKG